MAIKKVSSTNINFLVVIIIFGAFSLYSIFSFYNSTNLYIDNFYSSVLNSNDQFVDLDVPQSCYTCPPFPICDSVCEGSNNGVYQIFTDIDSTHSNAIAIEALSDMGIVNGYPDGSFGPDNYVLRSEVPTLLVNAIDADFSGGYYQNCFPDVGNEWFSVPVCYAREQGWVSGYADGTYGPGNTIVRAEAVKIILEALSYEIPATVPYSPFIDVAMDDWFVNYAFVAKENGVIGNVAEFRAGDFVDRAEFVQMVYNAMFFSGLLNKG